jgi:catechol 2,3-dioxygenase-like lactoylglutathione lyase family enzyme
MSQQDVVAVSHVAIATGDLDRAVRFYAGALGFTYEFTVDIGQPFDTLTQIAGLKGRAAFLNKEAVRIELAQYEVPELGTAGKPGPLLRLGLTHLSFLITDIESVASRIEEFGGQAHRHTRVTSPKGPMIFANDPDGNHLELWQFEE